MSKYLFLAAIGPVQELIATARRSRDLWFGSFLLSELSRAAAQALEQEPLNGTLIFPSDTQGWRIVNRVLAEVTTDLTPKDIGGYVSAAVKLRLEQLRKQAFLKLYWDPNDQHLHELARRQVDDLYELFWVAARQLQVHRCAQPRRRPYGCPQGDA